MPTTTPTARNPTSDPNLDELFALPDPLGDIPRPRRRRPLRASPKTSKALAHRSAPTPTPAQRHEWVRIAEKRRKTAEARGRRLIVESATLVDDDEVYEHDDPYAAERLSPDLGLKDPLAEYRTIIRGRFHKYARDFRDLWEDMYWDVAYRVSRACKRARAQDKPITNLEGLISTIATRVAIVTYTKEMHENDGRLGHLKALKKSGQVVREYDKHRRPKGWMVQILPDHGYLETQNWLEWHKRGDAYAVLILNTLESVPDKETARDLGLTVRQVECLRQRFRADIWAEGLTLADLLSWRRQGCPMGKRARNVLPRWLYRFVDVVLVRVA